MSLQQLNWLDWTLAVLLAAFLLQGLWLGFSRVVTGLAATIAGILLGLYFYGVAGSFFAPYVKSSGIANVLGFFSVFGLIQILGAIVGWALNRFFRWTGLGWMDRLLGASAGALKGVLVAIVIVMVMTAFPVDPLPESIAGSRFAPYVAGASEFVSQMAPHEFKGGFAETYGRLKEYWHEHRPRPVKPLDRARF